MLCLFFDVRFLVLRPVPVLLPPTGAGLKEGYTVKVFQKLREGRAFEKPVIRMAERASKLTLKNSEKRSNVLKTRWCESCVLDGRMDG